MLAQRAMRPPASQHCRVELLSGIESLAEKRDAWARLWRETPDATPFQSPAWLLPWAAHFAPDRTHALAIRAHDRLRAMLPFFSWEGKLMLAGTGPSDYGDGLFADHDAEPDAGHRDEQDDGLAAVLLAQLCEIAGDLECACIDLQQLRAASPLLRAPAPPGWSDDVSPGIPCPVAPIRGAAGMDAISPHWRKNAQRGERLLSQEQAVEFVCTPPKDAAAAVATLERLHGLRWGTRDASHVFAEPLHRAFMYEVIPALAADGLLRLHCLHAGGEPAAMVFAMGTPHALHFYLSGFDPRWSRFSTGLVTLLAAVRHAASEQAQHLHLLRGCEAYKYHLGAVDQPTFRRVLRPAARAH